MSTGVDEAASSSNRRPHEFSTSSAHSQETASFSAADQTAGSIHFRNGVTSPGSPGSDADSTINSTTFAPSILASRLGRSLYSSTGAAGSSLSLSGSGFNSPTLVLNGFNAVSTVLNNPSKRQHPIDPKSSRFPAITPTHVPADIPKVKKSELDSYLSTVRPEWDRFMRNQSMGRQGKAKIEQQQQQEQQRATAQESSYDSEPLGKVNRRHRSTASMASLTTDLQAVPPPQARRRLPNLSAVPQVFFAEDFDLGNPYTFDQVTERYKAAAASSAEQNSDAVTSTYDVALNQMLQEKLSYYSDVIEQHLIIEIGQQSSSFFSALENLNELNAEAESCLLKINTLKAELQTIDDHQAKKGLRVIREQQHRRRLERKQEAVQNVRQIIERRDLVRLLLQQGETEEALDLLNKLRSSLRRPDSEPDSSAPEATATTATLAHPTAEDTAVALSELQCLASLPAQLEEMEHTLSAMLEQDLIAVLKDDIHARLASYQQSGTSSFSAMEPDYFSKAALQSDGASGSSMLTANIAATESLLSPTKAPASPFGHSARALSPRDAELASRIAPLVIGLTKTGGIEKAVAAYREVAIQVVQATWKETLSRPSLEMADTVAWLLSEELSKYDDHDNLPPPAARVRDLEHASFLSMGRELFETLIECLKAIDAQCKLIPRILEELDTSNASKSAGTAGESGKEGGLSKLPSPPTMPQGVPTNLPAKMSEVVVASAEQAHSLCARLLSLRATTHAALELPPFLVVFQLCWGFVLSSEQLCRKMIVGLRGTVLSQAKGFLANFHRRRIERAAKAVEEETWAQAEVGVEIQAQIRQIVSSAVEDPADFVVTGGESQTGGSGGQKAEGDATTTASDEEATPAPAKTLDIEDRQYFVVDASLDVLSLLVDYLKVITNLPLLTTEAMARVVEFLKQFNSRTCQVVLGAGAMRSAGLKNITAKHLALASQSLSIMISLIPYIRETVRRHLSPKQAVMLTEFDKLRRDFQEHQYEIHAKLVAIMSDRLTVHCRSLNAIDWNADEPVADGPEADESKDKEPNKYAADLVKETATLHKVLSKYLQAVVVEHVIGQVLRSIDARIAQEFDKVPVQNQHALDRMQTDVRYLGTKLSTLKHVEWKDEALQQVLASKRIVSPPSINLTTSAGSSTPHNEAAPGSPAIDKAGTSPFGPVTYKPRIPNIFARRQQQQQQQHSQAGSPRASTDVPGSSTPVEAQRSVETTPRTSMQLQRQPSQSAAGRHQETPAEASEVVSASAPEPSVRAEASGARSLEEEVNDNPPTPPSKTQEVASSAAAQDEVADARESEDLVAPLLPAPEAVAQLLADGSRTSSEASAAAPTSLAASTTETTQQSVSDSGAAVAPDGQQTEATAATPVTESRDKEAHEEEPAKDTEHAEEASTSTTDTATSTSETAKMTEHKEAQQPSTPRKDSRVTNVSQSLSTAAINTAESSPARSGASTPATATPSGTPAKPGRMSLKERLAEAARKRAQQSAPSARPISKTEAPQNQAQAPATSAVAAQPAEPATPAPSAATADAPIQDQKTETEAKSSSSEPQQSEANTTIRPDTASIPASADNQSAKTDVEATGGPAAEEANEAEGKAASEEGKMGEQNASKPSAGDVADADNQEAAAATSASTQANAAVSSSEAALAPIQSEAPKKDVGTASDKVAQTGAGASAAIDKGEADATAAVGAAQHDKESSDPETKASTVEKTPAHKADEAATEGTAAANGISAPTETSKEAVANADAETNQDADGDEGDADADADGDADPNEGTQDSAVGGTTGAGSKKNKKKKKKGKKK